MEPAGQQDSIAEPFVALSHAMLWNRVRAAFLCKFQQEQTPFRLVFLSSRVFVKFRQERFPFACVRVWFFVMRWP